MLQTTEEELQQRYISNTDLLQGFISSQERQDNGDEVRVKMIYNTENI